MDQPMDTNPGARRESAPTALAEPPPDWSPAQRISFRFVFVYLAIYMLPSVLGLVPGTERLAAPIYALWQRCLPWVARELFHLRAPMAELPDGGGDSTTGAVFLFCMVALAAVATLVWTLADRRSRNYRRLHAGLRVYVRYGLAFVLLHYGIAKLIKTQFVFPSPARMAEIYGDASPMGLLWTFMGYSTPYNVFTGLVEAGAGFLLLFRQTVTAGALLAVAAMANVVAINFSYDVHVKHWSSHLLLLGVFLLAPDLRRLAHLVLLNRPTAAVPLPQRRRQPRWLHPTGRVLKLLFVSALLIALTKERFDAWKKFDAFVARGKASPARSYRVASFVRNGALVPAWPGDPGRWLWFTLNPPRASVTLMSYESLAGDLDAAGQTLVLQDADRKKILGRLAVSRPGDAVLVLTGRLGNDSLAVTLDGFDPTRSPLATRGFHWIDEAPFDR
jgi:hypothetical protein